MIEGLWSFLTDADERDKRKRELESTVKRVVTTPITPPQIPDIMPGLRTLAKGYHDFTTVQDERAATFGAPYAGGPLGIGLANYDERPDPLIQSNGNIGQAVAESQRRSDQRPFLERMALSTIGDPATAIGLGSVPGRIASIGMGALGGVSTAESIVPGSNVGTAFGALIGGGLGGGAVGGIRSVLDSPSTAMGAVPKKAAKAAAGASPPPPDIPLGGIADDIFEEGPAPVVRSVADLRDLQLAAASTATHDGMVKKFPMPVRKAMGIVNPSLAMDRSVTIANRAGPATQAAFETSVAVSRHDMVKGLDDAFPNGLTWVDPTQKAALLAKDARWANVVDTPGLATVHPEWFVLTPAQEAAIARQDAHGLLTVNLTQRHGSDVTPFKPDRPGASYFPTVEKTNDEGKAITSIMTGLKRMTTVGQVKERYYQDFVERMEHDPKFIPELDHHKVWAEHDSALARESAKEVQMAALGGISRAEAVLKTNPNVVKQRDTIAGAVDSLKEKIDRRLHNTGLTQAERAVLNDLYQSTETRVANQYNAQMSMVSDDVVNRSMGRIEALKKQLSEMQRMEQARAGKVGTWSTDIAYLQGELTKRKQELTSVRKAYSMVQPEGYAYDASTFRYFPSEIAKDIEKIMQRPNDAGGFIQMMDFSRNIRFGIDGGLLFLQGLSSVAFDPFRRGRYLGQAIRSMTDADFIRDVSRAEHDDVVKYSMYTGRQFGNLPEEFNQNVMEKLPAFGKFAKAQERTLDYLNYRAVLGDARIGMKNGLSEHEAWTEAANANSKMGLRLNPADRALSVGRGRIERAAITSVSFTTAPMLLMKDAAMGMGKFLRNAATGKGRGSWDAMPLRERLAAQRLMWFIGSMEAISLASAAAVDPEHMEDAVNPNSPRFMSIFLPGGGSIGLGGPFRSAFRALVPDVDQKTGNLTFPRATQWIMGKWHPVVGAGIDTIRNADYRGNPIATDEGMKGLWQAAGHILENTILPAAVQSGIRAVRNENAPGDVIGEIGTSLLGTNYREQTPVESIDRMAEQTFGTKRFQNLSPGQKQQLRDNNPELFERRLKQASVEVKAREDVRAKYFQEQRASDQSFQDGTLKGGYRQWKSDYNQRRDMQRAALEPMYKQQAMTDPIMAKYQSAIQSSMKPDGHPDWDKVDTALMDLTPEEQEYINTNTNVGGTPLVRRYNELRRQAAPTIKAYDDIPDYLVVNKEEGEEIKALVQEARSYMQQFPEGRMTTKRAIAIIGQQIGASTRIIYYAQNEQKIRNPRKALYKRSHPILEQVWGELNPFREAAA